MKGHHTHINTPTHKHTCPVPSRCCLFFGFFLTSSWMSADQQMAAFSGARKERSRPDGGVSAAAVRLTGALISLCSQSGSDDRSVAMGPSQRAESSREAETDNGITGDADDATLLLLFIAPTLGCDETPQLFGSITHSCL